MSEIVLPTLIILFCTSLLWALLLLAQVEIKRAGIIVSLFVLLFFSYGHIQNAIEHLTLWGASFGRRRYTALIWGFLLFAGLTVTLRTRGDLKKLTRLLNVTAVILVAFPLFGLRHGITGGRMADADAGPPLTTDGPLRLSYRPNIYYIILDGYARADILKEFYHYDNSRFLKWLSHKGFYIAKKSRSNYSRTLLSLASSLNMRYHDELIKKMGTETADERPLWDLIKNNRVADFLKLHGYVTLAFSTGYPGTEISNADLYLTPGWSLSEFQNEVINMTPITALAILLDFQFNKHADRILFTFDHIADATQIETPVFVFAHIVSPHWPFVFGQNGERMTQDKAFRLFGVAEDRGKEIRRYTDQLIFINKKVEEMISDLLANSSNPPIIILQSDHGASPHHHGIKWRQGGVANLSAFYFPDGDYQQLYETITPVNTFHIILNQYFGTNLPLLEDRCYFSADPHRIYKLEDVTDMSPIKPPIYR